MKKKIYYHFLFVGIFFMIPFNSVLPQDAHYWNIQYGTRSTLLGGAVIGSVSDLSATFYNPGAVALFPDRSFVLSAMVYQIETITVDDGAGPGRRHGLDALRHMERSYCHSCSQGLGDRKI